MEEVFCDTHGTQCLLKTGVKDGPTKGKSFYLCSVRGAPCDFTRTADIPPSHCLHHEDSLVELQAVAPRDQKHCYRLLFRCIVGKKEGLKWCGSLPWKEKKAAEKKHSDREESQIPGCPRERNPFKVPSKTDEASEWRILQNGGSGRQEKTAEQREENTGGGTEDEGGKKHCRTYQLPPGARVKKKSSGEGRRDDDLGRESAEVTNDPTGTWVKEARSGREEKRGQNRGRKSEEALGKEEVAGHGGVCEEVQSHKDAKKRVSQEGERRNDRKDTPSQDNEGQRPRKTEKDTAQVLPADGTVVPCSTGAKEDQCSKPVQQKGGRTDSQEEEDNDVLLVSVQLGTKQTPLTEMGKAVAPVQKTLTSFPGFHLASHAKAPQEDPQTLHNQLSTQLKQKKATLSTVNLSALPDKGERLKNQVKELEEALESLSLNTGDLSQPEPQSAGDDTKLGIIPSQTNTVSRLGGTILLPGPCVPVQAGPSPLGLDLSQGHSGVNPQVHAFYGGRMTESRMLVVRNVTTEAIDHLHHSLESCPGPDSEEKDPRGIKVPLLPHQRRALAWLRWRETQKPCGGILADDMGLGKTLTMIALILARKQKEKKDDKLEEWISKKDSSLVASQGTLIICPASLVHHWKNEIEKRVKGGHLSVYLYHGPNRQRSTRVLADHDMVVTTYSLVSKEIPVEKEDPQKPSQDVADVPAKLPPLMRVVWARVILDEAHNIKNPKAQTSIAVCRLRAQARWAVTGTPVQNNLLDMYSLLKFLRCSPFDEYKLWKAQVDNGSKRGGERLNILTQSLLLRRTKGELDSDGKPLVALPDRVCEVHHLKLSEDEQAVYDVIFTQSKSTLQSYLKRHERDDSTAEVKTNPFQKVAREFGVPSDTVASSQPASSSASSAVHILSLLLRLRQCCCHLSLLKKTLDQSELQGDGITLSLEEQLGALSLSEPTPDPNPEDMVSLNGNRFRSSLFEDTSCSTKIAAILSELRKIREAHSAQKCVIVSQWTSMLHIVAVHLRELGLRFAVIDGTVNPKRRMDLVEEFNNDPKGPQVMLVSLCAGGVGINLVGGNHLFLMDMHWNPALEDQACDRIYRVGQTRNVTIHRFVCGGTVEEKISSLQEKKKELAKKVLSGTSDSFTKLSLADLRVIFGV
ncbi:transcription termination factor 2 [Paramormyrops kingsleyae]|uniref:transcription termination factor 2 n=1 Tax=Paramormyrops kingsleyae TaxID=1676925 RepID=UPI003B9775BF